MRGKLTDEYSFNLPGVQLVGGAVTHASTALPAGSTVTIRQEESGRFKLRIEVATDDCDEGLLQAQAFAERLANYFSFRFARGLNSPIKLDRAAPSFRPEHDPNSLCIKLIEGVTARAEVGNVGRLWPASELSGVLADFERSNGVALAPALEAARAIFLEGMRATHPVPRFLILYTALMLFCTYKGKPSDQASVDDVLLAFDNSIPQFARPLRRNARNRAQKTTTETLYTAARNGFIHAEDRGQDPLKASEEIQRVLPTFQQIVSGVLLGG